eukprot:5345213-Pleurochrysis_carterae.AAC.1
MGSRACADCERHARRKFDAADGGGEAVRPSLLAAHVAVVPALDVTQQRGGRARLSEQARHRRRPALREHGAVDFVVAAGLEAACGAREEGLLGREQIDLDPIVAGGTHVAEAVAQRQVHGDPISRGAGKGGFVK